MKVVRQRWRRPMLHVQQLHAQLQQHADEEQMLLSIPDSKTLSTENMETDNDVDAAIDAALDDLTLSGEEDDKPSPFLKKFPELLGYYWVYRQDHTFVT